jgi:hypothetical protein
MLERLRNMTSEGPGANDHAIGYCPKCDGIILSGEKVCRSCGWIVDDSKVVPIWRPSTNATAMDKREAECKWGYDTCVFCGAKLDHTGPKNRKDVMRDHYLRLHPNATMEKMKRELEIAAWGCSTKDCGRIRPGDLVDGKCIRCGKNLSNSYLGWQLSMNE